MHPPLAPRPAPKRRPTFVDLAIHCAQGSALCASGHDDPLPDEPGGYTGYKGLFGAQEINPVLSGSATLFDLLGNAITDPFGQPGFPGFDGMSAAVSLAYVAQMQEKGIPVTYAYISDAHDFHGVSGNAHVAFGPGDVGLRPAAEGIRRCVCCVLYPPSRAWHHQGQYVVRLHGRRGRSFRRRPEDRLRRRHQPCLYGANEVGEINANIDTLVSDQFFTLGSQFLGSAAPNAFTVHGDDAPPFYLARKGGGPLSQTDPLTRQFERDIAKLTAVNPYTGATDNLMVQMADQTGMKALHMIAAGDPARNATFVLFADPDYFLTDFPASTCRTCINPAFAWNHGDIQPEIAQTWLGFVGPGSASWVPRPDRQVDAMPGGPAAFRCTGRLLPPRCPCRGVCR